MNIWFTSDHHFGHAKIIELCNRPFSSVEEMNEILVERWNSVVARGDMVFYLGDFAMGQRKETVPIASRLNGVKLLVPGNHDKVWGGHKKVGAADKLLYHGPFLEGLGECKIDLLGLDKPVKLCHFPYEGDSHAEDRYVEHRPSNEGDWLIHGHVHDAWKVKGKQINVGADVWDFTPVHSDQIRDIIKTN